MPCLFTNTIQKLVHEEVMYYDKRHTFTLACTLPLL
jgi:hypothetical protein